MLRPPGIVMAVVALVCTAAAAESMEDAKLHYRAGASHYEAGRYADAIREFQAAYDASKKPEILFNIARAHTRLGHDEEAIAFLKRYLEAAPDSADAASVRAEIEARERALAERRDKTRAEVAAELAKQDAAAALREAATAQRRAEEEKKRAEQARYPKWPGYALLGGGGGVLVIGVALGAVAVSASNRVAAGSGEFSACCAADQNLGLTAARAGLALDIVGGAMVAAGVGLTIWAHRGSGRSEPGRQVRLLPAPGGLAFAGGF